MADPGRGRSRGRSRGRARQPVPEGPPRDEFGMFVRVGGDGKFSVG